MTTYMWKELEGYPDWRVQTEDSAIARKLRRHSKWKICGFAMNAPLWVYRRPFNTSQEARRSLRRLAGRIFQKNASTGELSVQTQTNTTPN